QGQVPSGGVGGDIAGELQGAAGHGHASVAAANRHRNRSADAVVPGVTHEGSQAVVVAGLKGDVGRQVDGPAAAVEMKLIQPGGPVVDEDGFRARAQTSAVLDHE